MISLSRTIPTFSSQSPSALTARVQFSGMIDSLQQSREKELANQNIERAKAAEAMMDKQILVVGEHKLTGFELLTLLEELTRNRPQPAKNVVHKAWRLLIGTLSLGMIPIIPGIKIDKITNLFAQNNNDVQKQIAEAYHKLMELGLVHGDNTSGDEYFPNPSYGWRFRLTPEGREALAKRTGQAIDTPATAVADVKKATPESKARPASTDLQVMGKQTTLANALRMDDTSLASTENLTPLQKARETLAKRKSSFAESKYRLFFVALLGGLSAFSINAINAANAQKLAHYRQLDKESSNYGTQTRVAVWEGKISANLTCTMILMAMFMTTLAFAGISTITDYRKLRKDMQDAERLEGSLVEFSPETEVVDQRLVTFLKGRIEADSQRMAKQFQTIYDEHPETRSALEQVFGSREQLPSATEVQQLFKYYTYHMLLKEQGVSGWEGKAPVAESEFYSKMSTLMRIGMERGELFEFVKANRDKPFGQQFDEELFAHVDLMVNKIQAEVLAAKTLLAGEVEIEEHLKLARNALVRSTLSTVDRSGQTQQITKLIDAFKSYQDKLRQTLSQAVASQNPINLDALETVSLDEMICQLETALEVEKFKDKLQPETADILSQLAKPEAESTPLKNVKKM